MDQARFNNAIALRNSGKAVDALREFRLMAAEADDANEKASLLANEATCYCRLSRLADAERALDQARTAARVPSVFVVVDFLAACLADQQGKSTKALVLFERALQKHGELLKTSEYRDLFEDIQQRRAFILLRSKRNSEALLLLEEATSFTTLSAEDQQEIRLCLGICYAELHKNDLAKQELLRAIDCRLANDTEVHARYRLGLLYFADHAFAQAKHQLEAILEGHPGDILNLPRKYIYEQLSTTCHYLGDEELAKRYRQLIENRSA
jgi:tetratricopeptide (TPR) repeat protein